MNTFQTPLEFISWKRGEILSLRIDSLYNFSVAIDSERIYESHKIFSLN